MTNHNKTATNELAAAETMPRKGHSSVMTDPTSMTEGSRILTTANNDKSIITKSSETCQRLAAIHGMTDGRMESLTQFTVSHTAIGH